MVSFLSFPYFQETLIILFNQESTKVFLVCYKQTCIEHPTIVLIMKFQDNFIQNKVSRPTKVNVFILVLAFASINQYRSKDLPHQMNNYGVEEKISINVACGEEAIWAVIEENRQQNRDSHYACQTIDIHVHNQPANRLLIRDVAHSQLVDKHSQNQPYSHNVECTNQNSSHPQTACEDESDDAKKENTIKGNKTFIKQKENRKKSEENKDESMMKVAKETLHHMNNQEARRSTKDDRDVEVTLKVLT